MLARSLDPLFSHSRPYSPFSLTLGEHPHLMLLWSWRTSGLLFLRAYSATSDTSDFPIELAQISIHCELVVLSMRQTLTFF